MPSHLVTAILAVALGSRLATANCAYGTSLSPRIAGLLPDVNVSTFSYDGLSGPLNWFGLNKTANSVCSTGSQQSPIVINSTIATVRGSTINWTVANYPQGAKFENLGTNVEVVVNGSLVDTASGVEYSLAQFHFHTPAEHRVGDEFFPMEMHWVFESDAKQFAVLAFLVELCGTANCTDTVLESVLSRVGDIARPGQAVTSAPLAFGELIAKFENSMVYRYNGSLTTPPCTENVAWFISKRLLSIELSTWQAVKKVIKYNARYTQDMLGSINLLQNAADELN